MAETNVYEVQRIYRYSKWNPTFVHHIITAKQFMRVTHYISTYKNELPEENFVMSCHGNACKPTAAAYHRTDKKTLLAIKEDILSNKPISKIYAEKDESDAVDFSQCVRNPKQIYNVKMKRLILAITDVLHL